jgi:hypothetical protein
VPSTGHDAKVLGSWKEIAAYLGKGVRTAQRWEQELGLPVRWPDSLSEGVVVATPQDLDLWLRQRWASRGKPTANRNDIEDGLRADIQASRDLRRANRDLMYDLARAMEGLRGESQALLRAVSSSETKSRTTGKPRRLSQQKCR